jgi:hypothetical protein
VRKPGVSGAGREKAMFKSYEIGDSRFDEQGTGLAEEFGGIVTDRGCGAVLYDPAADLGNTKVTRETF